MQPLEMADGWQIQGTFFQPLSAVTFPLLPMGASAEQIYGCLKAKQFVPILTVQPWGQHQVVLLVTPML